MGSRCSSAEEPSSLATSFTGAKGNLEEMEGRKRLFITSLSVNWQCQEKLDRLRDELLMFSQVAPLLFLIHLRKGRMRE